MYLSEKWIWLPQNIYPQYQTAPMSRLLPERPEAYCVAEFSRVYTFSKKITHLSLRFSGDTEFALFCNGKFLATGPASVGGDFYGNEQPRDNFYACETELEPDSETLEFFARVKLSPVWICEYSRGHGGFMLQARVRFEDGTKTLLTTDSSWMTRRNGAYTAPLHFDSRISPDPWVPAQLTDNIWHTQTAPIPPRQETLITPSQGAVISLAPGEETQTVLTLDKIYAGFLRLEADAAGTLLAEVHCQELQEEGSRETVVFGKSGIYRGLQLHSAGQLAVSLKNASREPACCKIQFLATCYPVEQVYRTETSDKELNQVLSVCRHTLQYCRQTHHLDSPRHCEPLACTGDYYIESLMTLFSFGDMRLAEFDILRTAKLLQDHDGRMFHTTYSLIWVRMLRDVCRITGNPGLLRQCQDALILLLQRFRSYLGKTGLLETPPDFMFVDWVYVDGFSLHHPPKALGQSCLNLYYFGALEAAADIFSRLGESAMAEACLRQRESLRSAVNSLLFDREKGLYFEGLNSETPEALLSGYMPANTEKRYYLKQSNILAACFGVCSDETSRDILDKIMSDQCPGVYQPYFAHFLLEAIFRCGLRDKYTLAVLEQWKAPVRACGKGLVEGFVPPEPGYCFDHSHAWGGTPLYALPKALLGLSIDKPGMEEITLDPSLLGLSRAAVEFPVPGGRVTVELEQGKPPKISAPQGIRIRLAGAEG